MNDAFARIYSEINSSVRSARHVLVVTHAKPDGDAIGSMVSFALWLDDMGVPFTMFCADPAPPEFSYLALCEKIKSNLEEVASVRYDLMVMLDVSEPDRAKAGSLLKNSKGETTFRVVIDHHVTCPSGSNVTLHDPGSSSTCEILHRFFSGIGYEYSPEIATSLMTGIISDTEGFTNHATSARTLESAREIMKRGANLSSIRVAVHHSRTFEHLKMMGDGLKNISYNERFGAIVTMFFNKDKNFNDGLGRMSGFSNLLKRVNGGKIAIVLEDRSDGTIKGSIRSLDSNTDSFRLARALGGGGHKMAAGFLLKGSLVLENNKWKIV